MNTGLEIFSSMPGMSRPPALLRHAGHRAGNPLVGLLLLAIFAGCGSGNATRNGATAGDKTADGEVDGKSVQVVEDIVEASDPLIPKPRPGSYLESLSGTTVSFEMVPVPAGMMPDSTGTPTIRTPGFWISSTEVPWDVYDVYVFGLDGAAGPAAADAVAKPSKPYVLPGDSFGHAGLPALGMTARAADHFVEWLSAKTGHPYRILTEAEWEYACGLATGSDVINGEIVDAEALSAIAWHAGNGDNRTHAVGEKVGGLGIHDLLGNASEWVHGRDGRPVVKGGSYRDEPSTVTCEARRLQTKAWNMTDPQLPKSPWWLSDGPFVALRIARDME
jgi:formylglycine-generating enzyme required for sulfatase activity